MSPIGDEPVGDGFCSLSVEEKSLLWGLAARRPADAFFACSAKRKLT